MSSEGMSVIRVVGGEKEISVGVSPHCGAGSGIGVGT